VLRLAVHFRVIVSVGELMKRRAITILIGFSAASVLCTADLAEQTESLRVCADADYLPYSNRAGEGFENKIAAAVSKDLSQKLEYVWGSYRGKGGFPNFFRALWKLTNATW